jgi:hypothetical protein
MRRSYALIAKWPTRIGLIGGGVIARLIVGYRAERGGIALESVPAPDNPKTALLACYSALAAIEAFGSNVRYGP